MFNFNFESTSLVFKNEYMELICIPEDLDYLKKNGFDSKTSNGEFKFTYNNYKIIFTSAAYGGGSLTITLNMTDDIKESLEKALKEWKLYMHGIPVSEILKKNYRKI